MERIAASPDTAKQNRPKLPYEEEGSVDFEEVNFEEDPKWRRLQCQFSIKIHMSPSPQTQQTKTDQICTIFIATVTSWALQSKWVSNDVLWQFSLRDFGVQWWGDLSGWIKNFNPPTPEKTSLKERTIFATVPWVKPMRVWGISNTVIECFDK